jgi:hypothetical protein
MEPVNRVVFRITPKGLYGNTVLVTGLLVFVWVHWRGQRHVELVVFSVLAVLAISLYTLRSELCLSLGNREISGTRTWLGIAIRKIVVRVGVRDALYLTEDRISGESHGSSIYHQLEASGQLLSPRSDKPEPYTLSSHTWLPHRIRLEEFAEQAVKSLRVSLEDSREVNNRLAK